jgi:hypothetical protein
MANLFSNSMILPLLVVATRSSGANTNQALPLILVASMSRSPMMAVVLAAALVRGQKPIPPVVAPAVAGYVPPAVNAPGQQVVIAKPADIVEPFGGMLSFHGLNRKQAKLLGRLLGLRIVENETKGEIVVRQHPGIGVPPKDDSIELWFGSVEPRIEVSS